MKIEIIKNNLVIKIPVKKFRELFGQETSTIEPVKYTDNGTTSNPTPDINTEVKITSTEENVVPTETTETPIV